MKRQKKIRFKVVKRRTRMSAIINGNSSYARRYIAGQEVYAPEGTLGIFVFKNKTDAWQWADCWIRYKNGHWWYEKDLIVIPVLPIGRGKEILYASLHVDSDRLADFYRTPDSERPNLMFAEVPDKTMAFPGVYVLE